MYTETNESLTPFWVMFTLFFLAAMLIANWADKKHSSVRFWPAFIISLFLSPVVGAICIALAPEKEVQPEL